MKFFHLTKKYINKTKTEAVTHWGQVAIGDVFAW